jgi:hypothetical protein
MPEHPIDHIARYDRRSKHAYDRKVLLGVAKFTFFVAAVSSFAGYFFTRVQPLSAVGVCVLGAVVLAFGGRSFASWVSGPVLRLMEHMNAGAETQETFRIRKGDPFEGLESSYNRKCLRSAVGLDSQSSRESGRKSA